MGHALPLVMRALPVLKFLRAIALAAVLLGIVFRFYQLGGKVFWEDEIIGTIHMQGYTEAEIVESSERLADAAAVQRYLRPREARDRRPLDATIRSLAAEDPQHPPLYYLAGHVWAQLFGSSAAAIRSLSAVFGVLVLPCVYWLCLELFGSAVVGLFAVALFAVSPFWVLYSQEAREYSLWTVAILLDSLLFLRAVRLGTPLLWIGYGALTALALYVYPLTGLVAFGFGVYLIVRDRFRITRPFVSWAVASLAALAAFAPWLALIATSRGVERGMAGIMREKLSPVAFVLIFARDLRFPFFDFGAFRIGPLSSTAVNLALTVLAVALAACAIVSLVRREPFRVWGFVVIGLCLSTTPLLLQDLLVRGHFVYQARYFIPLLAGVQLSVAALFAATIFGGAATARFRRGWMALFAFVMCGEVLSCALSARADTWWNKAYERSRAVAEIVNGSPHPVVVSTYYSPSVLGLAFYLDPGVKLRVDMKCSQCSNTPAPRPSLRKGIGAGDTVFELQLEPTKSGDRSRWINPLPFPARPDPLNMFLTP